jgi:hypothetical protein
MKHLLHTFRESGCRLTGRFLLMIFLLGCLTALLVLSGDSMKSGIGQKQSGSAYGGDLYVFAAGTEHALEVARKIDRPSALSVEEALNLLARHLEETYFFQTPEGENTRIRFSVENLHSIGGVPRRHCIAVINMMDEEDTALRHFFQGSFGGQTTFFMITATFLQAQNDPPLLDGLVLLYNGKTFPHMDHIDFSGIVTPKSVRRLVRRVITAGGKMD